ncbi:probable plastid-lipid-associated protein 14, chloroplastic isoform X2 [Pistacia vera]|uniref:probable plastid-lipid-associated protein 14, chloroplastic isoform X2 n=1 Tax=Pistacia vera TaxID=55513 RepID=UPI001263A9CC|nr:probable plastid-lipid-associated protein 14, chloroplastic isoform X2 [Pistacia vera]
MFQMRSFGVQCSSSRKVVSRVESEVVSMEEEESGHVMRFKMSDFKILDRVSLRLVRRVDEVVFEAIVNDSNSPLYHQRVC